MVNEFSLEEYFATDLQTHLHTFSMHVRSVPGDWKYPSHEHTQYELNYLIEGVQLTTINGKSIKQRAGDLILIRPGEIHFSQSADGDKLTYFCIHFLLNERTFSPLLQRSNHSFFPADSPLAVAVSPYLKRLIDFCKKGRQIPVYERMRMHAALFELFAAFSETLAAETGAISDRKKSETLARQIAGEIEHIRITPYIHGEARKETVGIEDIARKLGISVSYCCSVFKDQYGMSPRQYLSLLKLQKAKQLLAQIDLPVDRISELLGYRDIAHFSRQFKRWTGYSPTVYRNNHTGSPAP
ncbi:AraC family transcriptional regulator [Paenibacillus sp. P26]|nr:AraC family transcriptional regulator [Paenibacillus sp. P26]UUZ96911.1 AraC family transcriptional regulator [Paenibacillus sp. P25]